MSGTTTTESTAATPAPEPEPKATFICEVHGTNDWNGEIQCNKCGAAYTTRDPGSSMHATPRCARCNVRLMPVDAHGKFDPKRGKYYSMVRCCSVCFAEAPGMAFQKDHAPGSPYCKGLDCAYHGPQLRKLQRRAAKAQRASSQKDPKPTGTFEVQVPGMLGLQTYRKAEAR